MAFSTGGSGLPIQWQPDHERDRRSKYEGLVQEIIRELYGNARYWDFFQSFNDASVHDFISDYASRKAWYLVNGPMLVKRKEREAFLFRDLAEACFWEIQQKKLFNMQCEWRAGLLDIPAIRVTRDFICFEKKIKQAAFVAPVTAEEVCLYIDYLKSDAYAEKKWFLNWQDYELFREGTALPAWYRYYDEKTGAGYVMMLPDQQGDQEQRYMDCWRSQQHPDSDAAALLTEGHPADKPELAANFETLKFFIQTFESKNLMRFFEAAEKAPDDQTRETELQDALRLLRSAEGSVRLPAADDWREAVIAGARRYKTSQIATHIPLVYEEYLLRNKSGITYEAADDDGTLLEFEAYALEYRERIEAGKKLFREK